MVSSLTSSLVKISAMEDLAPVKTQNSKENTSDFFFFFCAWFSFCSHFFPGSASFPLCSVHLACLLEPPRKMRE